MNHPLFKKHILYSFLVFCCILNLYGQKQGNIWLFGEGGGLNFNNGAPVAFSGSQVYGNPIQANHYRYNEGCTSISDSRGNLLFYSNGEKVWNKFHQVMPNGSDLMGSYSSSSAAIAIPMPWNDSLFYIFTTDGLETYLQNGLRYSIINVCLDNAKGDVIPSKKNILLLDTVSEKLCAIAHPNGTDIWLIAHKHFTNSFYSYLITPNGIEPPIITNIGTIHTGNLSYYKGCGTAIGQMKASSNGTKIGLVFSNVSPSVVEIFDFNPIDGRLSNALHLSAFGNEYGIEFSPDNSKVYTSFLGGIMQYDISSGIESTINASAIKITNAACIPAPMQLGPDGKIYVSRCSNYLGVINAPNNVGINCNYVNNGLDISPAKNNSSLPNFIAGFNYDNYYIPYCIFVGTEDPFEIKDQLRIPDIINHNASIKIKYNLKNATLNLYNAQGILVGKTEKIYGQHIILPLSNLSHGIFFLQIIEDGIRLSTQKIIVIN